MKKKLLIVFTILLTSLIPVSSFAVYSNLTKEEAADYYREWMLLGTVIFLVVAAGLYAFWRNINKSTNDKQKKSLAKAGGALARKEIRNGVLVIIAVGLLIRLAAAIPSMGYGNDVALFESWGNTASKDLFNTYNILGENIDYPPGYVYILFICGTLGRLFGTTSGGFYDLIIRLPAITCDCLIAYFIYLIAKDKYPKKVVWFFTAFWMFSPLAFLDSTVWGQVDSVLTFALVAGFYLTMKEKYLPAAVIFGAAIMIKPQAIIVLPVFCYALFKNKKISTVIYSGLACIGTAIGVALPFALSVDMRNPYMIENVTPILKALHADGGGMLTKLLTPFAWILSLFMGTAGHYDYASVNALNFFFGIGANWTKDSEAFMGLTYFKWGMIAIVIAALLTWFIYIKTKKSASLPFAGAAVILMLVANFGPRMHERYFFPAVVFLLIAAILRNNRTLFSLSVLTSVFGFFSVFEILVDLNLGIPYMWPGCGELAPTAIQMILAFGNVLLSLCTAAFVILDSFGKIENTRFNKKIWRQK